jgi:hypothetical protein
MNYACRAAALGESRDINNITIALKKNLIMKVA